jgi:hypothetical protein
MALAMTIRRLGMGDLTVHGASATGRGMLASISRWRKHCLAHAVGNAVTQAYLRTTMIERRRPVIWASFVTGESSAMVLPMAIQAAKRRGSAAKR